MSGKNFCKVEQKWCKFLKRGVCIKTNSILSEVNRCPRVAEIETVRLSKILTEVKFEDVFSKLIYWFPDQEKCKEGYNRVFNELLTKKPKKHNLNDLFIMVRKETDNGVEYSIVSGIRPNDKIYYALEFCSWEDWVSMFITQDTLDNLSNEEIVAGCLYEMTFFGFTEESPGKAEERIVNSIEECKKKDK